MSPKSPEESFSISKLADEFEISTRTIRFYEEKGLISPTRSEGNQRIYTKRDRARLKLILRGKRFGYSLEEISEIIGLADIDVDEVDQLEKALKYGEKKLTEVREKINDLALLEQDIKTFYSNSKKRLEELTGKPYSSGN